MRAGGLVDANRDRLSRPNGGSPNSCSPLPEVVAFGTVAEVAERSLDERRDRRAPRGTPRFGGVHRVPGPGPGRALRPAATRHRTHPAAAVGRRAGAGRRHRGGERRRHARPGGPRRLRRRRLALAAHRRRSGCSPARPPGASGSSSPTSSGCCGPASRSSRATPCGSAARLAGGGGGDVLIVIDLRRYERWGRATGGGGGGRGGGVAISDGALPRSSWPTTRSWSRRRVGSLRQPRRLLALGNALVAAVASRLRSSATARLDRIEAAWEAGGALVEP